MKITSMRFYIILIVLCILIFLAYLKDLSIFSEGKCFGIHVQDIAYLEIIM